jgi:hypothetical protein
MADEERFSDDREAGDQKKGAGPVSNDRLKTDISLG